MNALLLLKRYVYNFLPMLKYSRLFSMLCRSVLYLSAIHCTRVLFPIKRHGIRKQRPYANAFLLYAAKFFFWSVCHWSNFELSTDDQHWNGCSRQKRVTQCIYNFLFLFHFLHIATFVNLKLITFQIEHIPFIMFQKWSMLRLPHMLKSPRLLDLIIAYKLCICVNYITLLKYSIFSKEKSFTVTVDGVVGAAHWRRRR